MKRAFKIMSLFTGTGGMDLGFEMYNHPDFEFKIVWANDNFFPATQTFERNFGLKMDPTDVWDVDFKKIPECDGILAGFPCQDFSVLNKQRGVNVKRGQLYTRVVDALAVKKPLFFVAENVKGIVSANNGNALKIINEEFENPGGGVEYNVKIKVLNFADYGVPQTRQRTIFVGLRKDLGLEYEFPVGEHTKNHISVQTAFEKPTENLPYNNNVLEAEFNNDRHDIRPRTTEILNAIPPGGNYKHLEGKFDKSGKSLYVKGLMSSIYRRLDPNKPAYTVIAKGGGGTLGYHYREPRPLTNRERARLQSFPDNFVFVGKMGEVRELIGNAVPPLGAKAIAESVIKLFNENQKHTAKNSQQTIEKFL